MYVKSNENAWSFVSVSVDNLNFLEDAKGKFSYSCLIIAQLTSQLTSASHRSFFSVSFTYLTAINVFS